MALLNARYRVIAYDRRGFGDSNKPTTSYDFDVLAEDLNKLMTGLNLRDARYLGKYGSERVSKAVFMAAIPPFLLKTPDNPEGVDANVFDGIKKAIMTDRLAYLTTFFSNFYNADILRGKKVSDEVLRQSWGIGAGASPKGTLDCVSAWLTDFREELKRIDVPVLVIHGDADRILPLASTGKRMPEFVKGCRLSVIKDAPHGLNWTHAEEVNRELLTFLGERK